MCVIRQINIYTTLFEFHPTLYSFFLFSSLSSWQNRHRLTFLYWNSVWCHSILERKSYHIFFSSSSSSFLSSSSTSFLSFFHWFYFIAILCIFSIMCIERFSVPQKQIQLNLNFFERKILMSKEEKKILKVQKYT